MKSGKEALNYLIEMLESEDQSPASSPAKPIAMVRGSGAVSEEPHKEAGAFHPNAVLTAAADICRGCWVIE